MAFFFFFFLLFPEKSLCPPPLFGAELRHCKLNIWHTPLRHGYSKLNDLFKVNLSQTREYPCGFSRRHCFSMVIYIRNLKSRQHFRSYFNIIKTKDHFNIIMTRPPYNNERPPYNNERPPYNDKRPPYNNKRPPYNN